MSGSRKSEVKNIQALMSSLDNNERRYLSDYGSAFSAILENPFKDPRAVMDTLLRDAIPRSSTILEQLNRILLEVDSLATLGHLVYLDSLRRNSTSSSESFGSDAAVEFVAGIVTSFDQSEVMAGIGKELDPLKLYEIEKLLREFANLQNTIRLGEMLSQAPSDVGMAQLLLKMESQFDRTEGYLPHLERIYKGIFEPISQMAYEKFGFHPSLIFDLVKQQTIHLEEKHFSKREELEKVLSDKGATVGLPERDLRLFASYFMLVESVPSIEEDLEERLSKAIGKPLDEVKAAISTLCTDLGTQSKVTRLSDSLLIQNRPIIRLPDGRHLWLRPVDFPHEILNWFYELATTDNAMREAFNKSRQEATPKITYEILAKIFGKERSFLEPIYLADGQPDLDVLVTPPESAILAEVKAAHFTWQGRAGLELRVQKKIDELFLNPIGQLTRAEQSITRSPETWKDRNRRKLGLNSPKKAIKISVTLENIDPICTWAQEKNKREPREDWNVWPICLSNLMMVAEILTTPHEFYAYAVDRVKMFHNGNPLINMESDILSHWCSERLRNFNFEIDELQVLSYGSDDLNEYFTYQPLGFDLGPPTSNVPEIVLQALDRMYLEDGECWFRCVTKILSGSKDDWAQVKKSLDATKSDTLKPGRKKKRANRLRGGVLVGSEFVLCVSDSEEVKLRTAIEDLPILHLVMHEGTIQEVKWLGSE